MQLDQSHPNHKSCKPMSDKSKTFYSSNTPFHIPAPTNPRVTNPKLLHPQIHLMLESWPRKVSCQQQRKRKHNSFDRSKSSILILRLQGSIQFNPENLFVLVLKNFWWQILAASNSQILDWQECQPGVRGGDQSPDYENWELFEYFNIRETVLSTYQGDCFEYFSVRLFSVLIRETSLNMLGAIQYLVLNIEPKQIPCESQEPRSCISSDRPLRLWFRNSSIVSIW